MHWYHRNFQRTDEFIMIFTLNRVKKIASCFDGWHANESESKKNIWCVFFIYHWPRNAHIWRDLRMSESCHVKKDEVKEDERISKELKNYSEIWCYKNWERGNSQEKREPMSTYFTDLFNTNSSQQLHKQNILKNFDRRWQQKGSINK